MDYSNYIFTDKPVPYKELLFYPVKVRDFPDFLWYVDCLIIDKNAIPDIQVISMSYFQFLFALADAGDLIAMHKLLLLFCMVLKKEPNDFKLYKDGDEPYFEVDGHKYGSEDFLEIKKIILLQNDIDDIDETIQKELRDKLKEAEEWKARASGNKPGTFEDNILCFMCAFPGLTLEDIYEMPIRKFNRALKRADHKLHYEIYTAASMSGMVTFKDKNALKHWMTSLDEPDKFKDVKIGFDELRDKISMDRK